MIAILEFVFKWRNRFGFGGEFAGYFISSSIALAIDIALLLLLARVMHPLAATTTAFLCGLLVCYGLTVRFVFSTRHYVDERAKEAGIFFLVGLVGLGINDGVIYLGHIILAQPLVLSKLMAAAISFTFNYAGRKCLLFRTAKHQGAR